MAYPLTSAGIEASIESAANAYPTLCQRVQLPFSTNSVGVPARQYSSLLIGKGAAKPGRPGLLAIAGMHAREWAQPDACLSFVGKLIDAYKRNVAFVIPAFTNSAGATFGPLTVTADRVKAIIENVSFFRLPLANPDGREFSMSAKANNLWRKTRSPCAAPAIPATIGVDPNRNFDIAWDFDVYYSPTVPADPRLAASKQPAMENYIGPTPFSEAETKNIKWILDNNNVDFFIDLHSFSLKIMYPWSIETNQSADAAKNFRNAAFDHRRDGKLGSAYQEYFPDTAPFHSLTRHRQIAEKIRDAILAATGRNYGAVGGIAELLSTATGSSTDYAFSRQFTVAGSRQIHSFAIEFGDDDDHFQPDPATEYPRIEREVHAALISLLGYIAIWSGAIS
jgi:carboxypeptidase T